ncbi:MAG: hypothetical protein ABL998_00675 [Planctomycetota bacterium]
MITLSANEALLEDLRGAKWLDRAGQFTWITENAALEEARERWEEIQGMLLGWLRDPRKALDEDLEAPTPSAIRSALRRSQLWSRGRVRNPTRVAPSGDGGVLFDWRLEPTSIEVEVEADGSSEYREYQDAKLVRRTHQA